MASQSFRDIYAWQRADELTLAVYQAFGALRNYGFRDQIQRASVSVMNNIAEGYARRSDKSFRQFLLIAKGSCAEVESMLIIAEQLQYIDPGQCRQLSLKAEETGKLLSAFVRKLSAKDD